ncbi:hypothetical protein A1O3_08162 [Capronia epimyces CBS 606.96]|uniref:Bet v I/Major latex protein domain-containing protein n=1 Tax=Capronia epimyces CBS 606.96 TaxID=1182542 RepID=W9XHA9_9EURO|nr:uncharacterized protein A1O3_08162 [Capronia epimyces CBS 606.96]EXJ79877.1 hypothetical protein A1O3_08162 [Capronia epimyces CBS 606.96]
MSRTLVAREKDTLKLPVENVWAVVSAFGAVKTWIPTIGGTTVTGQGIGAVRSVEFLGNVLQEKLEVSDADSHTVSYRIIDSDALPFKGGYGSVALEPVDDKTTAITWSCDAEEVDADGIQAVSGTLSVFIKSAIQGLKDALYREVQPLGV